MVFHIVRGTAAILVLVLTLTVLNGCSSLSALRGSSGGRTIVGSLSDGGHPPSVAADSSRLQTTNYHGATTEPIMELGRDQPGLVASAKEDPHLARARIDLNFVDTDVREFSRVFFTELLRKPYVVDQSVSGIVTVRSGGQVDGNAALSLARQALEATGNTIRLSDGIYRVASIATVGYDPNGNVKSFALHHIDAAAAHDALGGLIQGRAEIISAGGDQLVLRGDAETLSLIGSMLEVIDVDRFRSASFGLFPLRSAAAKEVTEELKVLYGGVGVIPHIMVSIDRMNAVLVITAKPAHLEFAHKWVARLDHAPQNGRQVYVYQVRNRDADEVAKLMQEVYSTDVAAGAVVVTDDTPLTAPGAFWVLLPAASMATFASRPTRVPTPWSSGRAMTNTSSSNARCSGSIRRLTRSTWKPPLPKSGSAAS